MRIDVDCCVAIIFVYRNFSHHDQLKELDFTNYLVIYIFVYSKKDNFQNPGQLSTIVWWIKWFTISFVAFSLTIWCVSEYVKRFILDISKFR